MAISNEDPVLVTDFAKEMVRQMRAVDTYGSYDDWCCISGYTVNGFPMYFVLSKRYFPGIFVMLG
ncbi:MAG: hypothetical protein H6978_16750 [Gammaproteobacteria bacterium]|nr:hypothetical protein [Gammaproteobacteria bacterium]